MDSKGKLERTIGRLLACLIAACVAAVVVAGTIKIILWLF